MAGVYLEEAGMVYRGTRGQGTIGSLMLASFPGLISPLFHMYIQKDYREYVIALFISASLVSSSASCEKLLFTRGWPCETSAPLCLQERGGYVRLVLPFACKKEVAM